MRAMFQREVVALGLPAGPSDTSIVTDADLTALPPPAQRFLRFVGVVGRPRDWSFLAHLKGRFRAGAKAAWKPLDAWQYSSGFPQPARLFYMRLPFYGVPVQGRDTYVAGKGRMLIRPLDLFTVQDGTGTEFDLGELVTWLNDAVMMAPSMLLVPEVTWLEVNYAAFDLGVTDRGNTVRGRVFVDPRGAPTDFHTTDRWYAPPGSKAPPVRTQWMTPVSEWREMERRMLPARGTAVWRRPEGDEPYAEFAIQPGDIVYNVPPDWKGKVR